MAAKGCAGYSAVGMLFLLFIGTLIERQPLYIKGIKPRVQITSTQSQSQQQQKSQQSQQQQQQQRRYQGGVPTWDEEPHHLAANQWDEEELLQLQRQEKKRRRLQALRASSKRKTTTTTQQQQQPKYSSSSNNNNNNGYNSEGQWRMMTESSNAFKAAAAYFVTLVMSLIYVQTSHCEEVWEEVRLCGRILWARLIVSGQRQYHRIMRMRAGRQRTHHSRFSHDDSHQHYTDIPDASFGISSASVIASASASTPSSPEPLYREESVYHPQHNAMATLPTYHHATNGGGVGSHYNNNTGMMNPSGSTINSNTSAPTDFWRRVRGMGMSSPGGTKPKNV
eukprot:scaffold53688_cov55-Attheya_sp.AAC.2